jgi:hypothetical protein
VGQTRRATVIGFGLAVIGMTLQGATILTGHRATRLLDAIVFTIFLGFTIGEMLRYLLKKGPITADKLHGALAGYIMIALLFAFLYTLIETLVPGSFANAAAAEPRAFFNLLYFSFSTLTTVGFGDITPVTDQARSLVMVEAFTGVFFVGVLIARLAGLYPPHTK